MFLVVPVFVDMKNDEAYSRVVPSASSDQPGLTRVRPQGVAKRDNGGDHAAAFSQGYSVDSSGLVRRVVAIVCGPEDVGPRGTGTRCCRSATPIRLAKPTKDGSFQPGHQYNV